MSLNHVAPQLQPLYWAMLLISFGGQLMGIGFGWPKIQMLSAGFLVGWILGFAAGGMQ